MPAADTFADLVFDYWRATGETEGARLTRELSLLERFVLPSIGALPLTALHAGVMAQLAVELTSILGAGETLEALEATRRVLAHGNIQPGCPDCGTSRFHSTPGGIQCASCGWEGGGN